MACGSGWHAVLDGTVTVALGAVRAGQEPDDATGGGAGARVVVVAGGSVRVGGAGDVVDVGAAAVTGAGAGGAGCAVTGAAAGAGTATGVGAGTAAGAVVGSGAGALDPGGGTAGANAAPAIAPGEGPGAGGREPAGGAGVPGAVRPGVAPEATARCGAVGGVTARPGAGPLGARRAGRVAPGPPAASADAARACSVCVWTTVMSEPVTTIDPTARARVVARTRWTAASRSCSDIRCIVPPPAGRGAALRVTLRRSRGRIGARNGTFMRRPPGRREDPPMVRKSGKARRTVASTTEIRGVMPFPGEIAPSETPAMSGVHVVVPQNFGPVGNLRREPGGLSLRRARGRVRPEFDTDPER